MILNTIFGEKIEIDCVGCVVSDNSLFSQGRIFQTELFDISQDFELAIPGMMVISPLRHIPNIEVLTDDELAELGLLQVYCKRALLDLWECENVVYQLYEKPGCHIHLVIIPLWKSLKIKNKYAVLAELMARTDEFKADAENMKKVKEYILALKNWFNERLG